MENMIRAKRSDFLIKPFLKRNNLRACHKANIHLLYQSKVLKLSDFPNCFKYIIWDNKNEKLIPAK